MFSVFILIFNLLEQLLSVAAVEAPRIFLKKPMDMIRFDSDKSAQMTLGLTPKSSM